MRIPATLIIMVILLVACQSENKPSHTENATQSVQGTTATLETEEEQSALTTTPLPRTKRQIDSLAKALDELREKQLLTPYFYPNMSGCGGGVDGYYNDSTLVIIDATYGAELGFSSRKVYWHEGEIIKIIYREYFAEWGKYDEKYPSDEYEWDPDKMTYTDRLYTITLGEVYQMEEVFEGKMISEAVDSTLIERLIKCGFQMKDELDTEGVKQDKEGKKM